MKKTLMVGAVVTMISSVLVMAAAYTDKPIGQVLGFGAKISNTSVGGIAVASGDGAASVDAVGACQIGTGANDQAGSLKYRGTYVLDSNGGLGIAAYGIMRLKYSMYAEDWFEAGYLSGGTGTNAYKFSETENAGAWYLTVVDGGGDNAEVIKIMDSERNGMLIMTPNNAAADSLSAQLNGEQFTCRTNKLTAFNTRFTVDNSNGVAWVGMNLSNTTAPVATPGTDYMGFLVTNDAAHACNVYFKSAKDTTSTTNILLGTMAAGSYYRLGFENVAASLVVTYNGTVKATIPITPTGCIPDDEALAPVMYIKDTTTGQASLKVDYIGMIQDRE